MRCWYIYLQPGIIILQLSLSYWVSLIQLYARANINTQSNKSFPYNVNTFIHIIINVYIISINLPSQACMTDIAFSPSISFISLLLQVCWSTRSCNIWSRSQTWLNSLLLISSILGSGCSLYSSSQVFPVS